MLRHLGEKRSFSHNLRLAILLCLNAGFINAAGLFAFQVLTTNVTGHAALLAVSIASSNGRSVRMAALWLFLFLLGAFSSGLIVARVGRDKSAAYSIPILIILVIIIAIAVFGHTYNHLLEQTEYFAGALLFSMGMQNALVSMISGSVVRTTHLTGMFTDLGIDLSQWLLVRQTEGVKRRILLRLIIISFFLLGGVMGGFVFVRLGFHAFFVPAAILMTALFYDYFRLRLIRAIRKGHS